MNQILLSFVGFHDPYYQSNLDKFEAPGPIISMLQARQFDALVLFDTPGTHKHYELTRDAVQKHFPSVELITKRLADLHDPTDHILILRYLRRFVGELLKAHKNAQWTVSISSGTPSMHACWLLLAAEGSLPAQLVYGHPPKTGLDAYQISEVNLDAAEFPEISPKQHSVTGQDTTVPQDARQLAQSLGMIGENDSYIKAVDTAGKLARYNRHILLLGETGSGKERFAELIHRLSPRKDKLFLPVNCGALPADLAESQLFGHKKGSFTGAVTDQIGAFEKAHGGTLFLDEIGNMPLDVQAKLLRALETGEIETIGAAKSKKVDVRVVAATNVNLTSAIKVGSFRLDLYHRFSASIPLPPLRERPDDIPRLALHVLTKWNRQHNEQKRLSKKALNSLLEYDWPGNVRELMHAIEYAAMTSDGTTIAPDDLHFDATIREASRAGTVEPHPGFDMRAYLDSEYQRLLQRALEITHHNQRQAARLLGLTPQAVNTAVRKQGF